MKVAILVPYSPRSHWDRRVWSMVLPHLSELGPVFTGHPGGKWNRSRAINNAAKKAGKWDVAIIADADTIHDSLHSLADAATRSDVEGSAIVPWNVRWKLSRRATQDLSASLANFDPDTHLDGDDGYSHNDIIKDYPVEQVGSTIVVSRAAWESVGGFDEGFVGWGFEDRANRIAIQTLAPGGLSRSPSTIYHLWHPRDPVRPKRNEERFTGYAEHDGDPVRMLAYMKRIGHLRVRSRENGSNTAGT